MSEHGGGADEAPRDDVPRSRLYDYAEMTVPAPEEPEPSPERAGPAAGRSTVPSPERASAEAAEAEVRRREFAALLDEFRRTPVLVPLGDGPGPDSERGLLTADLGGLRFLLAFSDEQALARYAVARGEPAREWTYQTILGARLLDVAVPAAGVPCGVALDCADGEEGMVFPPVRGIVPDEVAVDVDKGTGDTR
ncbi:hypothetical protein AQI88_06655 [Streptomyces cellostaticus]|uniref:SseB protein N-terminal domain-containing protein n=1 Tax=Streptomyces cellostaticus TaxID=67285 RepID=A0A101NQX0_9ACTN|nr:hypothetical protein [Streptomyces cellostaticus]KUM97719.1 hypothetical protein AQI88_06655 [Streptomyces cellostaticus]GHI08120.1 hypothetical protein Scel_64410 [Streptomyces cellostaticus]